LEPSAPTGAELLSVVPADHGAVAVEHWPVGLVDPKHRAEQALDRDLGKIWG
jgi:hypothetical protein